MQDMVKKQAVISRRRTRVMGWIYGSVVGFYLSGAIAVVLPEWGRSGDVLAFLGGHGLSAGAYIWSFSQVGAKASMPAYLVGAFVMLGLCAGMIAMLAFMVGIPR
jgi:hypothetical protein